MDVPMSQLKDEVLQALDPATPTTEAALAIAFNRRGYRTIDVNRAVRKLQMENKVRWVAFEGWCRGGRPS